MRTHPLDRAFRKGLKGKTAAVPAGTWEAIQGALPVAKPTRSPILYWLLGSALVLALIAAIVMWPDNGSTNSHETIPDEAASTQRIVAAVPDSGDDSIEESAISTNNASALSPASNTVNETENNRSSTAATHLQASEINNITDQASTSVPKPTIISIPSEDIGKDDVQQIQPLTQEVIPEVLNEDETKTTNRITEFAQLNLIDTEVDYDAEIGLKVTDCYSFGKQSSGRFLVEAYTGPSFSLKSLSSRNEDVSDYIAGRDSTESSQLSWHAGLRVGYEHSSGLTGRAGVHYTLVNEVFKQETRYSRLTLDSIFDSGGNFIRVDTTLETGTRVKQTQNRYHTVDIPLLIGYRIDNGNWDLGIQAGPIFNIVFSPKGDMIDPTTGIAGSFSDTSDPDYHAVFKDKLGIGIYGSIYASKRVGENLWVFVEPHLHYRLKGITLDSYPVEQKQINIGLSFGVRLKL